MKRLPSISLLLLACTAVQGATLSHRWSFETDTSDSVGGNTGILNLGATVSDGQLQLEGLGSGVDGNGMTFTTPLDIGGNYSATGVTIESWYTDSGTGTWGKLFHFGNNVAGEELAFTHMRGNGENTGVDRGGARLLNEQVSIGDEHHLVITIASDGNLNAWVDGVKKLTDVASGDLSGVNTTHEAIGATNWNDPGMSGSVNEFRVWSGELTTSEVLANNSAGPDEIVENPDTDGDGLPDAWEERWFGAGNLSQGADDDPDADDLTNLEEFNFNTELNPNESDSDDDDLTDGREINITMTDPLDNDSDDDTLLDGAEVDIHNTDPLNSDSDKDFISDADEIANNTNPNDINDPGIPAATISHRWSFTTGAELEDSIGGNTGILNGTATVSDNQLQLDGALTGADAASMRFTNLVDLGGNFSTDGFTIETWYTDTGTGIWGKLFTFGVDQAGAEVAWTHQRGGEELVPGLDRNGAKLTQSFPAGSDDRFALNEEHHLVITVAPDGTANVWVDGNQEVVDAPTNDPSNITTSTESIGSTAWNDPGHQGSVNEFRIYNGTLKAGAVATNFAAGPDALGGSGLQIVSITHDRPNGKATITFNSIPGRTYRIDRSPNLLEADSDQWIDLDDQFVADSPLSVFTDNSATEDRYFYRVIVTD